MRVWYVPLAFPVGSETFATNEVRVLRGRGVDVEVHSILPARPNAEGLLAERGLEGVRLTHGSLGSHALGLLCCLRHPAACLRLLLYVLRTTWAAPKRLLISLLLIPRMVQMFARLRRDPPDVLHLYWGHYPCLLGYLVQHYLPRVVVSVSLKAYDLDMNYGGTGPVARAADVVWTIARANLPALKALGVADERIEVAYDGIDLGKVRADGRAKVPRRILTAGRLVPDKGVAEVLEVFRGLRSRWPDASLMVLGDGPERPRLERLAREGGMAGAVSFPGHVRQERVFEEMAAAEVFLFLSRYEGERLPNVVKEAMASGCACVVSATKGIEELVRDGETGYVVGADDLGAARQCVERVFAGDGSAMRERARRHVAEHFDLDAIMDRYHRRWEALVKEKGALISGSVPPLP
jgi:glycosyltransferase involved in cell wall biosynthesis